MYNQLATNPQCPFLYEDVNSIPQDWTEVLGIRIHSGPHANFIMRMYVNISPSCELMSINDIPDRE